MSFPSPLFSVSTEVRQQPKKLQFHGGVPARRPPLACELVELIVLFDYYGTAGARDKSGEETEPGTER
jgi:hypothetical protein